MMYVPISALSQPDDKGEAVDPVVGDVIDLGGAQAKIDSIDGDKACLSIQSINGAPVSMKDGDDGDMDMEEVPDEPGMGKEGAKLKAMAARMDAKSGF